MTAKIPIQNLYYLLAYAWDHYRSGEEIDVSHSHRPDVHILLAMLLAGGIRRLATKGMDKGYKQFTETTRHDRHRLHSSHLYQLVAYLKNKSRDSGWEDVDGILLYPAVDHHLDLTFSLLGHLVAIKSIDLNQDWPTIHQRLLYVLTTFE